MDLKKIGLNIEVLLKIMCLKTDKTILKNSIINLTIKTKKPFFRYLTECLEELRGFVF